MNQFDNLEIGTRIYNGGDMANPDHFGTIRERRATAFGVDYRIQPDEDSDYRHGAYWIPAAMFRPAYLGHGGTRIVLESAYREWHAGRMALLEQAIRGVS